MTDTDPTPERPRRPATGPVQYRGEDLDPERGPGLGCFRFQLAVLAFFVILTPLTVAWSWPPVVSAILLFAIIILLLISGQTIIFLLRLVAADRRGRRRPLASDTKTVGELEDESGEAPGEHEAEAPGEHEDEAPDEPGEAPGEHEAEAADDPATDEGPVRQ